MSATLAPVTIARVRGSAWSEPRKGARRIVHRIHYRDAHGKKHYWATRRTEADARAAVNEVNLLIYRGIDPKTALADVKAASETDRTTFREAVARFFDSQRGWGEGTRQTNEEYMIQCFMNFGDVALSDLTPQRLEEEWLKLTQGYWSLKKVLGIWKNTFKYARINPNPAELAMVQLPSRPKTTQVLHQATELEAIYERLTPRFQLQFLLINLLGVRIGTACGIEVGHWDADSETFFWPGDIMKSGEPHSVDVGEVLRDEKLGFDEETTLAVIGMLNRLVEGRPASDPLFPADASGKFFSGQTIRPAYRDRARDLDVAHLHPHDLRYRRATLCHHANWPDMNTATLLDHDLATLRQTYVQVKVDREINYSALLARFDWDAYDSILAPRREGLRLVA